MPYLWLALFFAIPFFIVLKLAGAEALIASPPFTTLFEFDEGKALPSVHYTLENFQFLAEDDLYWKAYLNSVKIAAVSTLLCLLIGYPMAYGIARSQPTARTLLLLLIILPFWTSFLLRIYAWMGILGNQGVLNGLLMWLGVTDKPMQFMYTQFSVYIGIVYSYLPFMILPLYATLERLDVTIEEAASDLGAHPSRVFLDVTLPLSTPGIVAGSLLVFIPAVGEYVIPALLGGSGNLMIGRVLFDEFFANRDWPVASAVAVVLLALLIVPIVWFQHMQLKEAEAGR